MLLAIGFVLIGLIVLVWSADKFIAGAASIASSYGMSKMIIGLTIVAFGTSAPEMLVSLLAALNGSNDIAVGNALGSNITNIGLVLGATVMVCAIPIHPRLLKLDIPILFFVIFLATIILLDYKISLAEGLTLLFFLGIYILILFKKKTLTPEEVKEELEETESLIGLSQTKAWFYFVIGLVLLIGSADLLVRGAVTIAAFFGMPELIIGVTIVALGTSLPELAASMASAVKGHHDIAFGNIIGSNIFNILVVMAMPGLVNQNTLDSAVLSRDLTAMILITLVWFILMVIYYKKQKPFGKIGGSILLLGYIIYYISIFT